MLSNQFKKFTPKKKAEVFYSNVSWTKIPDSQDSHDSQDYAITICRKIYWDYSKKECNTRGLCKKAWVTNKHGDKVYEIPYNESIERKIYSQMMQSQYNYDNHKR